MSVNDAHNFSMVARVCFKDAKMDLEHPMIFIKDHEKYYSKYGITTEILKELEMFSLLETDYTNGYAFKQKKVLKYYDCILDIRGERITAGNVRLTKDGQQLMKQVVKEEDRHILDHTIEFLTYNSCSVTIL